MASASVPPRAAEHLPTLIAVHKSIWPDAPSPSFLAAQVEQESCISLKHRKCWNPTVELKTSREYGFGLGQTTIAYRADGSVRFNKFEELRATHRSLSGWTWEGRFSAHYQLTALVEMDKAIYRRISAAATEQDRLAFTLAAYNGGEGSVRQDRLLCRNTTGCDHARWRGHTEHTSLKAKKPFAGYKQSPFAINREYVHNILHVRREKYRPYFGE